MKSAVTLVCIGLSLSACAPEAPQRAGQPAGTVTGPAAVADVAVTLKSDAAAAVQRFGAQLKGELQQALGDGGAMQAVDVCHSRAPAIADELSAETGFLLSRVSLRHRNAERGKPEAWQREVLRSFDQQLAAGATAGELIYSAVSDGEYRFMKAIATESLCLTCHGSALNPTLAAKLKTLYPEDLATGYQAGELRGAFSAVRALETPGP